MFKKSLSLLLFTITIPFVSVGQQTLSAAKITERINFDGIPDEEFWQDMNIPLIQFAPVYKGEKFKGQALMALGYDDDYLWVSAHITYEEDQPFRIISKKRDNIGWGSDYVGLSIDSWDDNENAVLFFVNPEGARTDGTIQNDAVGDNSLSINWNTFWDVKSSVNGNVWQLEMRVPLTSIKFQEKDNITTMGIQLFWYSAAAGQTLMMADIDQSFGVMGPYKPSLFVDVDFKGIKNKKPLYVAPYVIGAYQQAHEQNPSTLQYENLPSKQFQAGGDMKLTLRDGWNLDLTLNTDFAQVEADNQQINLSRFNLFFPEKRQFFQERASIFEVNTGYINQLFYSRTIGLDENAGIVPIYGGMRLIGRVKGWDIAMLDLQSKTTSGQLSSNYGVFRIRKQVSTTNSYVGGILTNKMDTESNYSLTTGLDGIFDLGKNNYLKLVAAGVMDTASNMTLAKNSKFLLYAENRTEKGFLYALTIHRSGENFLPVMGFERRPNTIKIRSTTGYGWFSPDNSPVLNTKIQGVFTIFNNNLDHVNDTEEYQIQWITKFRDLKSIGLELTNARELIREPVNIYGINITDSSYQFNTLQLNFVSSPSKKLRLISSFSFGGLYDGQSVNIGANPTYNPSSSFNVAGGYNLVYFNFNSSNIKKHIHFTNIKLEYTPNVKLSLALLSQYNSYDKKINSNFRLRYNPREGTDLYFVLNSFENTERNRYYPIEPILPVYDTRAVAIKYIHTFTFSVDH